MPAPKMILSHTRLLHLAIYLFFLASLARIDSHPFDTAFVEYNININSTAGSNVLDYNSDWPEKSQNGSRYTPSPTNWRELPIYTVILDR